MTVRERAIKRKSDVKYFWDYFNMKFMLISSKELFKYSNQESYIYNLKVTNKERFVRFTFMF